MTTAGTPHSRRFSLLGAAFTTSGLTMVSRVFGLIRDVLMASLLGAGPVADAFFVAFKLPNFFRRLFAEGAFNAAFVPLFSETLGRDGLGQARRFAEQCLAVMVVFLLVLVSIAQITMPAVMTILAPGFVDRPATFALAVELTRITFPYLLFISLVALMSGLLNSLGRFAAAAAAPVLLNLCLIAAMLVLAPVLERPGLALAWGVVLGGMAQLVLLVVACRRAGMVLRLPRPRLTPRVRRLLKLMLPGVLGAGVMQINLLIDIVLASLLPVGSVSYLFYADRLNQLPIGVVGVAVGTALLPLMARQLAAGQAPAAATSLNRAIELAALLTLPAAAAFIVVPLPFISVLLERGAFDASASAASAAALAAYAAGLPAYVMIKVLAPGFFARQDTTMPVLIAILCAAVNVVLNLILMGPLLHVGLALATAIASWLNVTLLAIVLYRRGHLLVDRRLMLRLPRMVIAAGVMAVALWLAARGLAPMLSASLPGSAGALGLLVVGGMVVYGAGVVLLGAVRRQDLRAMLRRRS